ncbi:MAG: hypothetical protein QM687_10900 [Ferruginibacter sp.]
MAKKHYLVRDLLVYFLSGMKTAFRTGRFAGWIKDLYYFPRWWYYRKRKGNTLSYSVPWLVFGAIDYLGKWLSADKKVFEYGSGGSTVFFAKRSYAVISVEHDAEWYHFVKDSLEQQGLKNVDYRLIQPEEIPGFDQLELQRPGDFISGVGSFWGMSFERYVNSIAGQQPDLVIIDGRARSSCIAAAMPLIPKGGILLLDNAERNRYLQPFPELDDTSRWEKIVFEGHFPFGSASILNKTILFRKK